MVPTDAISASVREYVMEPNKSDKVISKGDVYGGVKATILSGVTVGTMATIGAISPALQDIPDYAVAVGVPARVFCKREPPAVR